MEISFWISIELRIKKGKVDDHFFFSIFQDFSRFFEIPVTISQTGLSHPALFLLFSSFNQCFHGYSLFSRNQNSKEGRGK
jgi:hypothetical protein